MNQVQLGHSDLHVTPICLGTMTFGEQVDEATAHTILARAVERGINFIDTAEMYSVPTRAETFGEPARDFERTAVALTRMVETEHVALFASNMVIGEAYMAVQHHYGVGKAEAKAGLRSVLTSGLVAPAGGDAVLDALATNRGYDLLDRLIALQYSGDGLVALTLDRKMAGLPDVKRLAGKPPSR